MGSGILGFPYSLTMGSDMAAHNSTVPVEGKNEDWLPRGPSAWKAPVSAGHDLFHRLRSCFRLNWIPSAAADALRRRARHREGGACRGRAQA